MVDFKHAWVRFRDLPDDILQDLPDYVRATFLAARQDDFEVEMLCAQVKIPPERRARRRFVLVADDMGPPDEGGPMHFDLAGLAEDAREAPRIFVISSAPGPEVYAAAYATAVHDLTQGHDVALVVETRPAFAEAWARTLDALQRGQSVGQSGPGEQPTRPGPRRAGTRRSGGA